MKIAYRAEIDGLRALAVLSVVIYHAGIEFAGVRLVPGGFLGVDVFFVISGYLITSILLKDVANGGISLLNFYERRSRRILPALFAMVAVSAGLAWWLMSPEQLANFANSVRATAVFGSNIFFWMDTDYFAEAIELKPLAHTWSLAVEEQFYVFFPLLLMLWTPVRSRLNLGLLLLAGGLVSFASIFWINQHYQGASFYLMPTRAWELFGGAFLAWLEMKRVRPSHGGTVPAAFGIIAVVAPMGIIDGTAAHPGWVTVPVVLGTMALIWFGGGAAWVTRMLCFRPVVLVGLTSYSLYLWHQPVFSFARIYAINDLTMVDRVILIAVSLALGFASWRWIEKPFRVGQGIRASRIWMTAGSATLAALIFGYLGVATAGWPSRVPEAVKDLASVSVGYTNIAGNDCLKSNCVIGDGVEPSIVVAGDSHAAMLARSLDTFLQGSGKSAMVLADGDLYVSSYPASYPQDNQRLRRHQTHIFSPSVQTVILSSRSPLRVSNVLFNNGEGGVEPPLPRFNGRSEQDKEELKRAIREGIEDLLAARKNVVLIYPVPEVGWHVPQTLAKLFQRGTYDLTTSERRYLERTAEVREVFDSVGSSENLVRIYPERLLCSVVQQGRCSTTLNGEVLYHDDDHLSVAGTDLLIRAVDEAVTRAWGGF